MQSVQKYCCNLFTPVCPFSWFIFRLSCLGILSACYAPYEHTKGVYNVLLGILCEVTSSKHTVLYKVTTTKHAWVSLQKIWMGKWADLRKK